MHHIQIIRTIAILLLFTTVVNAQYTSIPDPVFEQFLIDQVGDDVLDGEVLTSIISGVTSLEINETAPIYAINDFTGIEDFSSLVVFAVALTNATFIDLGNNTNLERVTIRINSQLQDVDVSGCPNIVDLFLCENDLTSLNLTNNIHLEKLGCSFNNLAYIDIRNGNNMNIEQFLAGGNPNLECILVDDVAYSTANWTSVSDPTLFTDDESNCPSLSIAAVITDPIVNLHPNPVTDHFTITSVTSIDTVSIFSLEGKQVKQFTHQDTSYDIRALPAGIYLGVITLKDRTFIKKLIKK